MTCPHCGADAPGGKKFCPACSRLLDSPLLKMKQQLDAMRSEASLLRKPPLTKRAATLIEDHVETGDPFRPTIFPTHIGPEHANASDFGESHADPSHTGQAPSGSRTTILSQTATEIAIEARKKRLRRKKSGRWDAGHSTTTHQFEPSGASPQETPTMASTGEAWTGPVPARFSPPPPMRVYAILDVVAAIALFVSAARLHAAYPEPRIPLIDAGVYGLGVLGVLFVVAAIGLSKLWPIGRTLQRLLAFPFLFSPPLGTGYALFTLMYLARPAVKLLFSGKSPHQLNARELKELHGSQKLAPMVAILLFFFAWAPALAAARFVSHDLPGVLAVVTQTFPQLGTLGSNEPPAVEPGGAATADPEQAALADVGALMRGQAAYASLNEGLYDRVECVVAPRHCIRNDDPRTEATLLDPRFTQMERNGYVFQLRLSDPPETRPATASARGMGGFAYRAAPAGGKGKGFCGDHTGLVCTFDAEQVSGDPLQCPAACTPISPPAVPTP